jgi:tripartite-type tricarboxylate transporter receptor subunit TctC
MPMPFFKTRCFTAAAACAVAALIATPAAAADYYAGKNISFIIGTGPTGGFNAYARVIGPHLGRHLPGNPAVLPKNMPGAGSAIAATYLQRNAPRDGTVVAALQANPIMNRLLDPQANDSFDPSKFTYLAGAEYGTRLCMTFHTSKIKTYDDAHKIKAIIGATAPGGATADYALWHKRASGAQFEIVTGYKDPGDLFLAMERGEIDGVCGLDWTALQSQKPDWLAEKKLNLLVQDGIEPVPELTAMGVPQPWSYIKDPVDQKAVRLIVGFQQNFGKAYVGPPGVPDAQVKMLRDAFAAALRDEKLLADAKSVRLEIAPRSGEDVQKIIDELYTTPPEVVARMKTILTP